MLKIGINIMKSKIQDQQVLQIAQNNFYGIATIKTQNSDSLDFHDAAIWNIVSAISEAYELGYNKAIEDLKNAK
jgi:hypothetical protein